MRILQIEPDRATAQGVELMLKGEGFNVYVTDYGEEGVDLGKLYDYDLITTELNLPDMPGFDVIKQLRTAKVETPILVVTGNTDIDNKVRALGSGADDYLEKPFHKEELIARIHSIVRRSKGHAQSIIQTGEIAVNLDAKIAETNGMPIHLTGKEYAMLELLSLRKGTTLTKEMFLNHLYGGMDEPEMKIIDVFICKLRKKLRAATSDGEHHIQTVWGRGYVLRDPVGPQKAADAKPNQSSDNDAHEAELADLRRQLADMEAQSKQEAERYAQERRNMAEALEAAANSGDSPEVADLMRELAEARAALAAQEDSTVNGQAADNRFNQESINQMPGFMNGLRLPIGIAEITIGPVIIDTSEGIAANKVSGEEVEMPEVLCTLVEILGNYQGRTIKTEQLVDYIFENEHPANTVKLGMYMSQLQSKFRELVGDEVTALLLGILAGEAYGFADPSRMLGSSARPQKVLPAPGHGN